MNYGWALTPPPLSIPADGSTIAVVADGQIVGHPVYGNYRGDIATLFPGYVNSGAAVGYFNLDTTRMTNGMHTIAWAVTDSAGRADGIGSRYFNVLNSDQVNSPSPLVVLHPVEVLQFHRGYNLAAKPTSAARSKNGMYSVEIEELDRIDFQTGAAEGCLVMNGECRALPVGSSLSGGVFYWQLGPGFLGTYQLEFKRLDSSVLPVRVVVRPKGYRENRQ